MSNTVLTFDSTTDPTADSTIGSSKPMFQQPMPQQSPDFNSLLQHYIGAQEYIVSLTREHAILVCKLVIAEEKKESYTQIENDNRFLRIQLDNAEKTIQNLNDKLDRCNGQLQQQQAIAMSLQPLEKISVRERERQQDSDEELARQLQQEEEDNIKRQPKSMQRHSKRAVSPQRQPWQPQPWQWQPQHQPQPRQQQPRQQQPQLRQQQPAFPPQNPRRNNFFP